jgi:two-component system, NtrC family, response regulator HydG
MHRTDTDRMKEAGRVLVVDDKEDVLIAIRLLLKDVVAAVHTTKNPATVPALFQENDYDVVLLDMNFSQDASSGREGFEWLRRIRQINANVTVIFITAYGDVDRAVQAMKEGATDFVLKPWDNDRLREAVCHGIHLKRTREASARHDRNGARTASVGASSTPSMLGRSPKMQHVFDTVQRVARTDASVLVLGENGTGKEVVARAIHEASNRRSGPFVSVDLGAVPESLFESELFGHVRGAFTDAREDREGRFESASGGTLFLDEIGNIPVALQVKLLTVLQRREITRIGSNKVTPVDIRLISATNQKLYDLTHRGIFRQDLLFRINTVEIDLPPLRERDGDIELLANHFLHEYAEAYHRPVRSISNDAIRRMAQYSWPGNVRELRHTIERAVVMSEGDILLASDLSFSAAAHGYGADREIETLDLEEIERKAVSRALSKHGGNISRAAEELGISRKSLYRRIEKYGL